jgi:hypothetical protein
VKPSAARGERSQQLRTYLRRNSFIGEILPVWFELAKRAVEKGVRAGCGSSKESVSD